jgi:hypothetical protein
MRAAIAGAHVSFCYARHADRYLTTPEMQHGLRTGRVM